MTTRYNALAQRIRLEINELEQTVSGVDRHWKRVKTAKEDQDAFLNDEYRKFRHRVRNIYAIQLNPARMEYLVEGMPSIWQRVRTELGAFADFLERLEKHA